MGEGAAGSGRLMQDDDGEISALFEMVDEPRHRGGTVAEQQRGAVRVCVIVDQGGQGVVAGDRGIDDT